MKKNAGTIDRGARVVAGILMLVLLPEPWKYVGAVPILTGALGFCPLYTLLGINTCKR